MKKPVYFDYHSTTPCDPAVLEAMMSHFSADKFGNPGAKSHAHGRKAAATLEEVKDKIGALIGAGGEAITLTSGATESNNLALLGLAAKATGRKEIVMSSIEHNCVSNTAEYLSKHGFILKTVPVTKDGFVQPEELKKYVSDKTLVVCLITASHEIGTIQPLKEAAKIAHAAGALLHTDATQAAGKIPLNVNDLEVDLLSFSAHKLYGPAGIGALYVRQKPPFSIDRIMFGGEQQRLRPGTVPLALTVGFGEACRVAGAGLEVNSKRLGHLADLLLKGLKDKIPGLGVNGGRPCLPGLLNIRLPGVSAQDIMLELSNDLCMSTGAACASAQRKPSPILKAIGLSDQEVDASLRLTLGRGTTEEEVQFAAEALANAVRKLSKQAA
ncbi:MAG: cysteine desulfurase family protein [Alphaproteobacteria bacterium]